MDLETERWLPVSGYEKYQISTCGRLKGLNGEILKCRKTKTGRRSIALCDNGKHKQVLVADLVAQVFLGTCSVNHKVHHKDGNPSNDDLSNLEYVTFSKHNSIHAQDHPSTKFSFADIERIKKFRDSGMKVNTICFACGISKSHFYNVINGKVKRLWLQ